MNNITCLLVFRCLIRVANIFEKLAVDGKEGLNLTLIGL